MGARKEKHRPLKPSTSITRMDSVPPDAARALLTENLTTFGAVKKDPNLARDVLQRSGQLEHVSGPIATVLVSARQRTRHLH
ncbi:hypothetical protein GF380_06485 [Candidatus Uhrbacteria bacterium]|nr:hypothetical protein [Candidatus Uhrbacteria bacterium]MBD3284581.1 hypothetical protein [Candidatus Uhrbacteria bacterium]